MRSVHESVRNISLGTLCLAEMSIDSLLHCKAENWFI
jgi:hypothetical protein